MKSDIITKPNHGELSLVDNIFSEKGKTCSKFIFDTKTNWGIVNNNY